MCFRVSDLERNDAQYRFYHDFVPQVSSGAKYVTAGEAIYGIPASQSGHGKGNERGNDELMQQHSPLNTACGNNTNHFLPMPSQRKEPLHISIIGAGPAGCLCALLLSKFPCQIHLYDFRPDPRLNVSSRPRSINLALSTRGLTALREAGILEDVVRHAVPMHGRCVHQLSGQLQFQPYGQADQHLLSVSRVTLANILLDACQSRPGIHMHFQSKCIDVNLKDPSFRVQPVQPDGTNDGKVVTIATDLIVGADGAFSRVRAALSRQDRFDFSQSYIPALYKELTMNPDKFPQEWLHIWPRDRFMLIALPNSGGSFTCTLFMDMSQFEKLRDPDSVASFFQTYFPDAVSVMPSLVTDFFQNPTPSLVTVRCAPYNHAGNAVVIGDAAHAIVPFYGQGCNAAFEDCRLLVREIVEHEWSLEDALTAYSEKRKSHMDTLADLAIDHYEDMSSRSANSFFIVKRRMEIIANRLFPRSFLPLYSMISFSNIPYADAVKRAQAQDRQIEYVVKALTIASISTLAVVALRWLKR